VEHDDNGAHVAPVVADMHSDPICQGGEPGRGRDCSRAALRDGCGPLAGLP
jgi:hypothetical protein